MFVGLNAGGEDISDQVGNTITMTVGVTPPPPQSQHNEIQQTKLNGPSKNTSGMIAV